jgi:hypothetical protein
LLLSFLFVIEGMLVYGLLHLNHAADGSENELGSQQMSNQSDSSDNERQDSEDIESAESANITSDTTSPKSVTTSPSDLIQANQTSNMSKRQIKPGLNALDGPAFETLETVENASSASTSTPLYNVKVTFDTMIVNDDHEGTFSGDGEYDVAAYVQGIKILLSDKSGPGSGLWDVSSGETVYFDEGTEVILQTPKPRLISIFTVGSEKDNGCGSTASFPDMQSAVANAMKPIFAGGYHIPNMYKDINVIQDSLNRLIRDDEGILCGALNSNDILGKMNVIYRPLIIDSNTETVEGKTDSRDFILKFTVSIQKSPDPVERTEGLDLNKLPELANNELQIITPKVENYTILSPELSSNQSAGVD